MAVLCRWFQADIHSSWKGVPVLIGVALAVNNKLNRVPVLIGVALAVNNKLNSE